ncbi:MAG: exodeoxyribonuclease III [Bacteroidota bacterium]
MTRLVSFNVNGIRAIMKKDFETDMEALNPDILCLQETKAQDNQVAAALESFGSYHIVSNSATKKGYSGTAILSKEKPIDVTYDIGVEEHDDEGRVIAAEYEDYFVVVVYVPNAGSALKRLDYRTTWDEAFLRYLNELEKKKPVIVGGDFNVAHREIDLARPKANYDKHAGFTQKEIDGMNAYTGNGFVDTFRMLHPDEVEYSWWSYRGGARSRNVGWRIDYFLVSKSLKDRVEKSEILNDIMGSDHCPVLLEIQ